MVPSARRHDESPSDPARQDDAHTNLGTRLRQARERRGLTLETIARETKIPKRRLEALEGDALSRKPGDFYLRAEMRAYARIVGLDVHDALARLDDASEPEDVREPDIASPTPPAPRWTTRLFALAVGIVLVTLLGRAVWNETPAVTPAGELSPESPSVPLDQPARAVQLLEVSEDDIEVPTPRADHVAAAETSGPEAEQAAAPPSPAAVTELVVTTQPEGARVTVNGIARGTSPVTIRYLSPGEKRIRASKDGYVAAERVLQVREGRQHVLEVPLESVP
jgi:cytoskeletal protein RodZ